VSGYRTFALVRGTGAVSGEGVQCGRRVGEPTKTVHHRCTTGVARGAIRKHAHAASPAGDAIMTAGGSNGSTPDTATSLSTQMVDRSWYVVALRDEVDDRLLERTVAGRSLVLYRTSDGRPVVLRNRCSHRGYPLSLGSRVGDGIECGYHGFTFDCGGRCISVPGQARVPSRATVTAYPTAEAGPFVWAWIGEPVADPLPKGPPGAELLDEGGWRFSAGVVLIHAAYGLIVDNLLDLSHESWIHATKIGTPEIAKTPGSTATDLDHGIVRLSRHMEGVSSPPTYIAMGLPSPVDRWQDIEYHAPSLYVLHVRVAPAGTSVGSPQDAKSYRSRVVYGITPLDARTTHYFFAIGRDRDLGDEAVTAATCKRQYDLIAEDAQAVEAIQNLDDAEGRASEVSVKVDTGALAARRVLHALLERSGRRGEAQG